MRARASRIAFSMSFLALPLLGGSRAEDSGGSSSLVTLWAADDVRSAFSFDTGDYAFDVLDGQAVLDRAQIAFSLFEPDKLSTGFVSSHGSRVVDLGDPKVEGFSLPSDLAVHPPISVFHTLFLEGRSLYYRGPKSRTYSLKGADALFFTLETGRLNSFRPEPGHTYLMRYAPKRASSDEDRLVKFRVVDFDPGRQVTLRWSRLK